ncbi:MAG TPA: cupin domain-containing protein [Xanthomonadales bacterium]|nr:cupin domain-containing protein [Xanthomonadales bacterium]
MNPQRTMFTSLFVASAAVAAQAQAPAAAPAAEPAAAAPAAAEQAITVPFDDANLTWRACPPFLPDGCGIAVVHGDPTRPNADVFFRVPAGSTVPRHWHSSAERMVLVSGAMTVTYEGQAPIALKTGSYAYGPAKLPHTAVCAPGAPCVLFIAFEGPVDLMSNESGAK